MNYEYSASNNTFYISDRKESYVSAGTWPSDALPVGDDVFNEFSSERSDGKIRIAGVDGLPAWADPPTGEMSKEDHVYLAELEKSQLAAEAEQSIRPLERAKQLGIATDEELASLTEWERYSVLLMRVDTSLAPNIEWPQKPK